VEGDFHLGLGALTNSLAHHGFAGVVWVGIRGPLPPWAAAARAGPRWREFEASPDIVLRFVTLATRAHFTNFKPEFLLQVCDDLQPDASQIFYFDPDIVIKTRWSFFEEWAGYGVALVEDVNSPLPESHPRRGAWRSALKRRTGVVRRETAVYFNGGFVCVTREHRGFLEAWREALVLVGEEIGGLDRSMFSFGATQADRQSAAYPFSKTDQDALNIAVMTTTTPLSAMGAEGMDFRPGGWTMSHALGPEKPWRKHFLRAAFAGRPPTPADREFWRHAAAPLALFTAFTVAGTQCMLRAATLLGRFYRRA
jgi:hypothetical protein